MQQVDTYYEAFMPLYRNTRKKANNTAETGTTKKQKALRDSALIEGFVRKVLQNYLKKYDATIIKLARAGWPNPPLDWCDKAGRYIGEIKYTNYIFADLDKTRSLGVGIPEWKLQNLRLACGHSKKPEDRFFKNAWFVYCDALGKVYRLSLVQIDRLIDEAFDAGRPEDKEAPYVHYGKLSDPNDSIEAPPEFTRALFVPSGLWVPMGAVLEGGMLLISTSIAAKAARERRSGDRVSLRD